MYNMNKTNIIQQLDKMNDILDSNNLLTNEFDNEYKRSVPVINSKKFHLKIKLIIVLVIMN